MSDRARIVTVLADSRGLDTYYLNSRYPSGYGIDRVFATRLNRKLLLDQASANLEAVLVPDHFRAGSTESRILRLALTDPVVIVLCDGIWETLLNREKHFQRAEQQGLLPSGLFGSETRPDRETAGSVLTEMFLNGSLDVSPGGYAASLGQIVGYFARRRRHVYWLSLPVPPAGHRNGVHYAGNYRPLPGWGRCLNAINDVARRVLDFWGQSIVSLDPLIDALGGADEALLDLWHFTPALHDSLADHLAERIPRKLAAAPVPDRHPSRNAIIPGRVADWPVVELGRDTTVDCLGHLEDAIVLVTEPDATLRDSTARDVLLRCDESVIVVYPEEC